MGVSVIFGQGGGKVRSEPGSEGGEGQAVRIMGNECSSQGSGQCESPEAATLLIGLRKNRAACHSGLRDGRGGEVRQEQSQALQASARHLQLQDINPGFLEVHLYFPR